MTIRLMLVLLLFNFSRIRSEILIHEWVVIEAIGHVALKLLSFKVDRRNDLLAEFC